MSLDRPARDLGRLERGEPVAPVALAEPRREDRAQLGPVLDAVAVRREARVGGERPAARARTQNRGHCRSEPTATAISPSAVSNVSYGTMFGCALPRRPGRDAGHERVLRLVDEAGQGRPRGARCRCAGRPPGRRRRESGHRRRSSRRAQQRGQHAHRAEHPRHDVADRDADLRRAAAVRVGRAGDRTSARSSPG